MTQIIDWRNIGLIWLQNEQLQPLRVHKKSYKPEIRLGLNDALPCLESLFHRVGLEYQTPATWKKNRDMKIKYRKKHRESLHILQIRCCYLSTRPLGWDSPTIKLLLSKSVTGTFPMKNYAGDSRAWWISTLFVWRDHI